MFMLRAFQAGIDLDALDMLTVGNVLDIQTEKSNDSYKYPVKGNGAMLRNLFMH